jgi:pyruvate/2-oxoglutarate dehydrogenase complex dihydrolipoamide acyltransferase (E2) component
VTSAQTFLPCRESSNKLEIPRGSKKIKEWRLRLARPFAVTDQQARQILAVLLIEKKINARDAGLALARYRKRIAQLRAELAHLGGDGPFPAPSRAERPTSRPARRKRVSPKRRRAMRQQGVYLAAVRPLKPGDRATVKAVRQEKGFAAAVAGARRLGKG